MAVNTGHKLGRRPMGCIGFALWDVGCSQLSVLQYEQQMGLPQPGWLPMAKLIIRLPSRGEILILL